MKGGSEGVEGGEGSEIWSGEMSGEMGSILIQGEEGGGSKSLRGWTFLYLLTTSLL